jgi:hypothetical protein
VAQVADVMQHEIVDRAALDAPILCQTSIALPIPIGAAEFTDINR